MNPTLRSAALRKTVLSSSRLGVLAVAGWALQPALAAAQPLAQVAWLKGTEGGMPWQIGAMYFAFWVATAIEVAILSKSARRSDRPKKSESQNET